MPCSIKLNCVMYRRIFTNKIKTAIFRSVYRRGPALSMPATGSKQQGYLLIELMIAVAVLAVCSLLVAQLQAHMVCRYYEAEQYLKAVNYVNRVFEERSVGTQNIDGYTIETTVRPVKGLSYKGVQVTVSWKTASGVDQNITIRGGMLDEDISA